MKKIYINAAHSTYSPGGVCGQRNEHSDVLKFAKRLQIELERDKNVRTFLFTGDIKRRSFEPDDTVIVLHRNSNMKNSFSYGASVTVPENADADIQYEAYRLLCSICDFGFFRMKGVHTAVSSRKEINYLGTDRVFLFDVGYIDSPRDNKILDSHYGILAERLYKEIKEIIIKENKGEN